MLTLLIIICAVILFFAVFEDYIEEKYKWFSFILIAICLMMYAGLRPVGFDRDSHNYYINFIHSDTTEQMEPAFLLISSICYHIVQDVHSLFLVFATIGVSLVFISIKRLTPLKFLPILVYMMNLYPLHELTQIRAGVASGLFLFSLIYISEGKKIFAFVCILLACFFHISALVLFPILFLSNKPFSWKWRLALNAAVPVCVVFYYLDIDFITLIPISFISEKIELYKHVNDFGDIEKARLMSPFPLIKIFFFVYLTYFADTIKEYVSSTYLLIKVLGISIVAYFAFASFPIMSMRLSELYGIVEIVTFPCLIFTISPKIVGRLFVCIIALIELIYNLAINQLLNFDA